jgi:hypothetical protein
MRPRTSYAEIESRASDASQKPHLTRTIREGQRMRSSPRCQRAATSVKLRGRMSRRFERYADSNMASPGQFRCTFASIRAAVLHSFGGTGPSCTSGSSLSVAEATPAV